MTALPPPPVALPAQLNDPNESPAVAIPQVDFPAVAPPWFEGAIHQLHLDLQNDMRNMMRTMILPDLNRLKNNHRGDGTVVPFEVIPLTNGNDPTLPPNNLPPLHSVNAIENLNEQDLIAYLTGYGVVPLPAGRNPHATNCLQKDTLKHLVRAFVR